MFMLALHAPDGLFSLPVGVVMAVAVAAAVALSVYSLQRSQDHRRVPLMGLMAAFIFAAQIVNVPVGPGVSGHLLGGTLAAILLGPAAATIVMATVIFFQALLGDGGLTALGPNIFNMGLIGTWFGWGIYRLMRGRIASPRRTVAAAAFGAWCSITLASVAASAELALSGLVSFGSVLPPLLGIHMLIGAGEAAITAAVVAYVLRTRPDVVATSMAAERHVTRTRSNVVSAAGAMAVALLLAVMPALTESPDGFEYVGQSQGFLAEEAATEAVAPVAEAPTAVTAFDRLVEAVGGHEAAMRSAIGFGGTLLMFAVSILIGWSLTRPSRLERALTRAQQAA